MHVKKSVSNENKINNRLLESRLKKTTFLRVDFYINLMLMISRNIDMMFQLSPNGHNEIFNY